MRVSIVMIASDRGSLFKDPLITKNQNIPGRK